MEVHPISLVGIHNDPSVAMVTAPNPGPKTLSGTNTFVVGLDPAYIVDPGPADPAYQESLTSLVRETNGGLQPVAILLSHGHPDHAPGARLLKGMLGLPVLASPAMPEDQAAAAGVDRFYSAGEYFQLGSDRLEVLATPGHSPDQVAFWMPQSRILFSGDTILGQGSTLVAPPEGDMQAYMKSLELTRDLGPRIILPGHGPVIRDPAGKIEEYLTHRDERERQLIGVLRNGPSTPENLVKAMYADTDPRLQDLALGSVLAQLEKLTREGRVEREEEVYRWKR
jgi:glyoxylase-like metal-dependent hydrolase (beta-lactamase superfamily II)